MYSTGYFLFVICQFCKLIANQQEKIDNLNISADLCCTTEHAYNSQSDYGQFFNILLPIQCVWALGGIAS